MADHEADMELRHEVERVGAERALALRRADYLLEQARRYREALAEVEAIAQPAMDTAKLGTREWRALRDVVDVVRRARAEDA